MLRHYLCIIPRRFLVLGFSATVLLPWGLGCPECGTDGDCDGCEICVTGSTSFENRCMTGCRAGSFCHTSGNQSNCMLDRTGACCNSSSSTCFEGMLNSACNSSNNVFQADAPCSVFLDGCEIAFDECPEELATVPEACDPVADFSGTGSRPTRAIAA